MKIREDSNMKIYMILLDGGISKTKFKNID